MFKEKRRLGYLLTFILYLIIFSVLDYLNIGYKQMSIDYGSWLVFINVVLNITMAGLSAYLFYLSSINIKRAKSSYLGSNMSEIAVLFGILTYGCTPCVISFFTALSIPFVTIALPLAGLPYKIVSLLLILLGIYLVRRESNKDSCDITIGG